MFLIRKMAAVCSNKSSCRICRLWIRMSTCGTCAATTISLRIYWRMSGRATRSRRRSMSSAAWANPNDPREAFRPVAETEYRPRADQACRRLDHNLAAGIVGCGDLKIGEALRPVLEAHIAAGKGRFRGIRGFVAWHPRSGIGLSGHPPLRARQRDGGGVLPRRRPLSRGARADARSLGLSIPSSTTLRLSGRNAPSFRS